MISQSSEDNFVYWECKFAVNPWGSGVLGNWAGVHRGNQTGGNTVVPRSKPVLKYYPTVLLYVAYVLFPAQGLGPTVRSWMQRSFLAGALAAEVDGSRTFLTVNCHVKKHAAVDKGKIPSSPFLHRKGGCKRRSINIMSVSFTRPRSLRYDQIANVITASSNVCLSTGRMLEQKLDGGTVHLACTLAPNQANRHTYESSNSAPYRRKIECHLLNGK